MSVVVTSLAEVLADSSTPMIDCSMAMSVQHRQTSNCWCRQNQSRHRLLTPITPHPTDSATNRNAHVAVNARQ